MLDVVYVVASLAFFALMLGYAHVCDRLGARSDVERDQP